MPFAPFTLFPIVCGPMTIRRPDVTVTREPLKWNDWLLKHPLLTVDLLLPFVEAAALAHRLRDYAATPTIRQCLMVEVDRPHVLVYSRGTDTPLLIRGLENAIELPGLNLPPLPMAILYEDLDVH